MTPSFRFSAVLLVAFVSACGGEDGGGTGGGSEGTGGGSTSAGGGTMTGSGGGTTSAGGGTTSAGGGTMTGSGGGTTSAGGGTTSAGGGTMTGSGGGTTSAGGGTMTGSGGGMTSAGGGTMTGSGGGMMAAGGGTMVPSYVATHLAAGTQHTCATLSTGAVRCWGYREYGQLGNGGAFDQTATSTSVPVSNLASGATALGAGLSHTCAVVGGAAKCWGANDRGQLGNNSTTDSNVPVQVSGLTSGVIAVTGGYSHSCALLSSGAVKCWGAGDIGQLGDNANNDDSAVPVQVSGITSGATAIAAGRYHVCAVVSGALKCWGGNIYGELGNNSNNASPAPVTVSGLASGVTQVASGDSVTCAILTGGALECWGRNGDGQLGNMMGGTQVESLTPQAVIGMSSGVTSVAPGYGFTCAVQSGAAKCWGSNYDYSLGANQGPGYSSNVPVQVFGLTSGVAEVVAGTSHACARLTNGAVKCWGPGGAGQLGNAMTDDSNVPVGVVSFP